jgi:hypothetical protein
MHRSGITVSKALLSEVQACENNESCLFVKIEIEENEFVKTAQGKKAGDLAANIAIVQETLVAATPCYCLIRTDVGTNTLQLTMLTL